MIESSDNKTFKMLKSLLSSKGIKKESKCIVSGVKITPELDGESIYYQNEPDILLSKALFKELDIHGTNAPILLKNTFNIPNFIESQEPEGIEVLIPAGDPKNLGALIRTSLAFNASKIILLKEAASPFLPEVIKTSAGAVFKSPLFNGPSLKDLKASSFLYTLDRQGEPLASFKANNLRLLLGEEGGNIPPHLLKNSLSIQISSKVESLNVNSALSIALYTISKNS